MDLASLKKRIQKSNPGLPIDSAMDYLFENYKGVGTVYSPSALISAVNHAASAVIKALNAVCEEPYNLLQRHWFYHDEQTGTDYQLSDQEVADAVENNDFVHPATGDSIADFAEKIGLSYSSTEEFAEIAGDRKKKVEAQGSPLFRLTTQLVDLLRFEPPPSRRFAEDFLRDLLNISITRLQNNANYHNDSSEDVLTEVIMATMNPYDTLLIRDGNSNGHVDLFLKRGIYGSIVLVGEAKLHNTQGWPWYEKGLIKVVDKYARLQSAFGLLIYYYKDRDMLAKLNSFRKLVHEKNTTYFLRSASPLDYGFPDLDQIFVTIHNSRGRELPVVHVWVDLFSDTDDECVTNAKQSGQATASELDKAPAGNGKRIKAKAGDGMN